MGRGFSSPTMDNGIDSGWVSRVVRRAVTATLQRFDVLPQHIGIVMDGNRRYARIHGHSRKDGHTSGFQSMSRLLAVAYSAGIPEITVYAFSIENFNRSPEEVSDLMDIARQRLKDLVARQGIAEQFGVRVNVIGRLDLLPKDIQELAQEIMQTTVKNKRATLNLAMPYTAREDITQAIAAVAYEQSSINSSMPTASTNETRMPEKSITSADITNAMRTAHSHPLDLLIRTSSTFRLSDFLLWEMNESTVVNFVPDLWPEYTPMKFFRSILQWRVETAKLHKL